MQLIKGKKVDCVVYKKMEEIEQIMKKFTGIVTVILAILMLMAFWTMTGCNRPEVGSPEYHDPMTDQSPFEPADEFEYLVDITGAAERVAGMIEEGELPSDVEIDKESVVKELGLPGFEQENILAEANDKMVHAHGNYRVAEDEYGILMALAESGSAKVELQSHFPSDRWIGHVFIANPDDLLKFGLDALDLSLSDMNDDMSGGMGFSMDLDFFLSMYGFNDATDIYGWMGDELMMFDLTNPDFDPDTEPTAENVPLYTLLAISTDKPDQALDLVEDFWTSMGMSMLFSVVPERTEIGEYDAIVIPPPSLEDTPMSEMFDEEQKKQFEELPSSVAVALPGYFLVGDEIAVGQAVDLFKEAGSETGRVATFEAEWNWDMGIANFTPTNLGTWMNIVESEELQDLLMEFYNETRDLGELGVSRGSVVVQTSETFEIDILTSRESIRMFEIIQEIIEETPDETWEELGRQFGEQMKKKSGMGGF